MDIQTIQQKTIPLFRQYKVLKAGIFGSVARGEQKSDSDIDILVEMPQASGLFDFFALQTDLEERLSQKVDLVDIDAVHPRLKPYIEKDLQYFYTP